MIIWFSKTFDQFLFFISFRNERFHENSAGYCWDIFPLRYDIRNEDELGTRHVREIIQHTIFLLTHSYLHVLNKATTSETWRWCTYWYILTLFATSYASCSTNTIALVKLLWNLFVWTLKSNTYWFQQINLNN